LGSLVLDACFSVVCISIENYYVKVALFYERMFVCHALQVMLFFMLCWTGSNWVTTITFSLIILRVLLTGWIHQFSRRRWHCSFEGLWQAILSSCGKFGFIPLLAFFYHWNDTDQYAFFHHETVCEMQLCNMPSSGSIPVLWNSQNNIILPPRKEKDCFLSAQIFLSTKSWLFISLSL
jgi:hypothetical protein